MRSNPKLILSDDQKDHPDDDDSGTMRSPPVPSIASAAWANIAGRRCVVLHRHRYEGEEKPMNHLRHSDPAERNALIGCLTATGGQRALASGGKLQQVLRSLARTGLAAPFA